MNSSTPPRIVVIIPAFNEENSVGNVVREIPPGVANSTPAERYWQLQEVIVVNNNSNDQTAVQAARAGATVLNEPIQGYGRACLRGIAYAQNLEPKPDVIVFLDADYSDYPAEMTQVVAPILTEGYDMVIGSRALGKRQQGSMTPQQVFGNWLATNLLRLFYGIQYTDLGPFRAIRLSSLLALDMRDETYGWTVEMQLKAAKQKMRVTEVPVNYRKRIGFSKISGTVKGTIGAGYKILTTIFKYL